MVIASAGTVSPAHCAAHCTDQEAAGEQAGSLRQGEMSKTPEIGALNVKGTSQVGLAGAQSASQSSTGLASGTARSPPLRRVVCNSERPASPRLLRPRLQGGCRAPHRGQRQPLATAVSVAAGRRRLRRTNRGLPFACFQGPLSTP